jgi:hypothetical protein
MEDLLPRHELRHPDGRRLHVYGAYDGSPLPTSPAPEERPALHLRHDALTDRWVAISPARNTRPQSRPTDGHAPTARCASAAPSCRSPTRPRSSTTASRRCCATLPPRRRWKGRPRRREVCARSCSTPRPTGFARDADQPRARPRHRDLDGPVRRALAGRRPALRAGVREPRRGRGRHPLPPARPDLRLRPPPGLRPRPGPGHRGAPPATTGCLSCEVVAQDDHAPRAPSLPTAASPSRCPSRRTGPTRSTSAPDATAPAV